MKYAIIENCSFQYTSKTNLSLRCFVPIPILLNMFSKVILTVTRVTLCGCQGTDEKCSSHGHGCSAFYALIHAKLPTQDVTNVTVAVTSDGGFLDF